MARKKKTEVQEVEVTAVAVEKEVATVESVNEIEDGGESVEGSVEVEVGGESVGVPVEIEDGGKSVGVPVEIEVGGESAEDVQKERDGTAEGLEVKAFDPLTDRGRRQGSTGSIYPIDGGRIWGLCIQLSNADKALKAKHGNKLRYLTTAKSYEAILVKMDECMKNKDELLRQKLIKLGEIIPE